MFCSAGAYGCLRSRFSWLLGSPLEQTLICTAMDAHEYHAVCYFAMLAHEMCVDGYSLDWLRTRLVTCPFRHCESELSESPSFDHKDLEQLFCQFHGLLGIGSPSIATRHACVCVSGMRFQFDLESIYDEYADPLLLQIHFVRKCVGVT